VCDRRADDGLVGKALWYALDEEDAVAQVGRYVGEHGGGRQHVE